MEKKLTSSKKIKLLILVVPKNKVDYYVDFLQDYDANLQMVAIGNGTTTSTIFTDEIGTKRVIFSIMTEDKVKKVIQLLDEKFNKIKGGKGVAFAVPIDSVMGVTLFNFLSNNKGSIE